MKMKMKQLPESPEALKTLLIDTIDRLDKREIFFEEKVSGYQKEIACYTRKIIDFEKKKAEYQKELNEKQLRNDFLEEKVKFLERKLFGSTSEKLPHKDKDQLYMFNEAETFGTAFNPTDPNNRTKINGHSRLKRGRKSLPDNLPEEEVIHDLSPEDKKCPCCNKERPRIGQEESRLLDYIPAKVRIIKNIRLKYGPCKCHGFFEQELPEIKTASLPPRMLPGTIASEGLLAQVLTAKYADGLPLYRQSKIFNRYHIKLGRATMSNWVIQVSIKCQKIINFMMQDIRGAPVINMDETTVQVLKEPGRRPQNKSYMWIMLARFPDNKKAVMFNYNPSRSGKVAQELLADFKGFLQTDGYQSYDCCTKNKKNVIHVGCLAHIRRKFEKILKTVKDDKIRAKLVSAHQALDYIGKIYAVETQLRKRKLSADKFINLRQNKVNPILKEFKAWLKKKQIETPPSSLLGKAVNYALKEWDKFVNYLKSPLLTPDNNLAENAIRPFVVGRKNWLFSDTQRGANASANIYSLIETARANGLEPYHYLYYLFKNLPLADSDESIKKLLPYNLDTETVTLNNR